jgi:hypothetical protein
MAEVIEGHIRLHILDPKTEPTDEQAQAADDLMQSAARAVRQYSGKAVAFESLSCFSSKPLRPRRASSKDSYRSCPSS